MSLYILHGDLIYGFHKDNIYCRVTLHCTGISILQVTDCIFSYCFIYYISLLHKKHRQHNLLLYFSVRGQSKVNQDQDEHQGVNRGLGNNYTPVLSHRPHFQQSVNKQTKLLVILVSCFLTPLLSLLCLSFAPLLTLSRFSLHYL